jgi:hypothetical protein
MGFGHSFRCNRAAELPTARFGNLQSRLRPLADSPGLILSHGRQNVELKREAKG